MNRKEMGIAVVAMLMAVTGVCAEEDWGVGVIVGEPTGISVKKWVGEGHAIDAALAWSFSENESVQFHADYLFHNFGLLKIDPATGRLPVYCGIGGRVKLRDGNDNRRERNNDDPLVGVRVPFGISCLFTAAPVELFAEIVPVFDVVPDPEFDNNAAVGARFCF